ncbi:MAG: magnesium transporter [Desulfobacterales bacterium]|jgi:magnesium transporter
MTAQSKNIVVDALRRLLNRNATASLRKIVNKTHPADLARAFHSLSQAQQTTLFNLIDDREKQGMLMTKIDTDELQAIVESTDKEVFISILEQIPPDDVADLVGRLPEEIGQRILEGLNKESSEEIGELLQYDDQSAGGIMVPEFISLPEETTAKTAISYIQKEHHNVEMTFYLYVVDDHNKLVGVCSLRELVTIAPETPLSGFMTTDLHFVYVDSDQEQVARIVARYDLLAVPVIDHDRKLLGIVTVDDVIDIIRDEATEDILKMVGAGESFVETKSIFKSIKIRLPWLFASCMGGVLATFIIGHFESTLKQLVFLAAFIPVIMGMGGNVGTQSLTIVVRGLATDRIQLQNMGKVILKEIAIGGILGSVYGLFLGIVAHLGYQMWRLAVVVGAAVVFTMLLATFVGSMLPMMFARFRIDPAVATGPFVTTAIDIMSIFLYFSFAKLLFEL